MSWVIAESAIRGGGLAVLVVLAILLGQRYGRSQQGIATLVLIYCGAGHLLCPTLDDHFWQGLVWPELILAGCVGAPAALWVFTRLFFEDGVRVHWTHLAAFAVMIIPGFAANYFYFHDRLDLAVWLGGGRDVLAISLLLLALVQIRLGAAADLVEHRRRFRDLFTLGTALYGIIVVFAGLVLRGQPDPVWGEAANAGGLLLLNILFLAGTAQLRPDIFPLPKADTPKEAPSVDPEGRIGRALAQAMDQDKLYRQTALTIPELADHLGEAEYRLRRYINAELGYRNFTEFLNFYRLGEIKAQLADPDYDHLPVLTLALDAGYGSIGPFNRAFKGETGMTPTQWRAGKAQPSPTRS